MFHLTPQLRSVLEAQKKHTEALERADTRIIANRVPPARQANSELLCSLESSMSSRRSARTHSARFPANGRSEFRRSWGGAVGGNGNGGTPDRGHLRRYAITDEAMLKDAGEQLAAPATQLAPAKANGYVILAHVPLHLR